VAVPLPLDGSFHYCVPLELAARVRPGVRVLVTFGRRKVSAYVLGFNPPPAGQQLKAVLEVLDDEPLWTERELVFFRWIADYYLHPLGEVLKTALPAGINLQSRKGAGPETISGGRTVLRQRIFSSSGQTPPKPLRGKATEILAFLNESGEASSTELKARFGDCSANLKRLTELGLVRLEHREVYRNPFSGEQVERDRPKELHQHQQAALQAVLTAADQGGFTPFLLHGITGSGKTEVYLQAIAHSLDQGKSALVLVPEISLTPQLVRRFRARFGDGIAVLHSALSDGERYDEWRRIRRGEAPIVIGARSAIFAPLERIGIIVVDEEHEASFKQSDGLRYNARDLALVRGRDEGAVVLLGSATPLVTTIQAARDGRLTLLELPERVAGRPLPELLPITTRLTAESPLSPELLAELTSNLERGEQSLLFLNRRGFATLLSCPSCGEALSCPNCSVSLTYHRGRGESRCHYCDYRVPAPGTCPACGELELKELGVGTERVEAELRAHFPEARIARMDSDTTGGKDGHNRILSRVARGEVDILVGTQMIAKGHDFPGVTLVGVLQAEGSLYLPDFRAAERTFQVLSQVIGRAGRGELPGRVVLQAATPEHYAVARALQHDFDGFCTEELEFRQELGYPPFGHLAAIQFSGTAEGATRDAAAVAARLLTQLKARLGLRLEILGPAQAPLYRLRGRFRHQILLKAAQRADLRRLLAAYRRDRSLATNVREALDIDPVDLL
jgi:primosomal protein N' (replication factor Y)